jgi:hypothetical protein
MYAVVVNVEDQGNPPMSASENVTFSVTNINEFPPVFTEEEYSATILSGSPPSSILLQVFATDGDRGETVTYSILSQPENVGTTFSVDSEGRISNDNQLTGTPGVSHVHVHCIGSYRTCQCFTAQLFLVFPVINCNDFGVIEHP